MISVMHAFKMLDVLGAFTDVGETKGTQMQFRSVLYYLIRIVWVFIHEEKKNARICSLKLILFLQKSAYLEEF